MAQPGRNEPANLVVRGGEAHLVDAGDGAMTAVVEAGTDYRALRSVWISHIHFDHLGGLYAVLGLRLQTRAVGPLSIYGPPGMREIVNGLLAAMRPSARSGFGVPGEVAIDPAAGITVVELKDGDIIERDGLKVTIAANSHYSFAEGSAEEKYFRSYSFRFDLADRSIVYTGDTGPSDKVINLARGADLLVTEMVDLDGIKATMTRYAKHMSAKEIDVATQHLTSHHLTTADISAMAARAGVKAVVVTHIAGGNSKDAYASDRYAAEIGKTFRGPVHIAKDLERF
ncbi:MBL fold metallo-hydrolase [Sphingobium sp. AP50]|uniref:MBL fold metallo-hydrolase n=1 Tax=Sphingobium sp. AP50 TaxID=1884369 RepID=UPI0015A53E53|nr:MBL fold metallo-hydrolase [Sphingobium sp. AP50]